MINYFAIMHELRDIILSGAPGAKAVDIESAVVDDIDLTPWVGLYLIDRQAPNRQPLAAGRQIRYHVRISIWTYAFSIDSIEEASFLRDTVINEVEGAILQSPRLSNGIVSLLEGGEFISARGSGISGERNRDLSVSFLTAGETIVRCEVVGKT